MWTTSVRLVNDVIEDYDEDGFAQTKEVCTEGVPASITDTTRQDEVAAMQQGYTADCNIEIAACNYFGQSYLYDEATGERYDIKRTYRGDKKKNIILTCTRRDHGTVSDGRS